MPANKIPFEIFKQYKDWNISLDELKKVHEFLRLPEIKLSPFARPRRIEALKEAFNFESGPDQQHRKITELYSLYEYVVAVAKPGKEAAPDYKSCRHYITHEKTNNPNDMLPLILKKNKSVDKNLTFGDMFERVEKLMHSDLFGLEILGMLLFRAAFMIDHKKDKNGNWRYNPPKEIIDIIEKRIPNVSDIPVKVFLHYLEVLSLNEDVKVSTLGYTDLKFDYGRINTLLTFVHLIAVLLTRRSLSKFAGTFARPPSGMAPIPKTKAYEAFPLLSTNLLFETS